VRALLLTCLHIQVVGSDSVTASELRDVFELLTAKDIRPVLSQVLSLEAAADAHNLLEKKNVKGRVVLDVGGSW